MRKFGALAVLIVGAFTTMAPNARADECPIPAGANSNLARTSPQARIAFIHETLTKQAEFAYRWRWTWTVIGTGVAFGSFTLADRATKDTDRTDSIVAGSFALLVPIISQVKRLRVEKDGAMMEEFMRAVGYDGGGAPCLVLARAEQILERDAEDERANQGIFTHLLAIIGNGALFSVLAGLGHWGGAAFNSLVGLALSESQIWSAPTGAARAWRLYRSDPNSVVSVLPKQSVSWTLAPLDLPKSAGVSVRAAF